MKKIGRMGWVAAALVTINAFAVEVTPPPSGLVLWNRLGSADETENSNVGPNGTCNAGQFVPGRFGNAVELNMQQKYGVTFPLSVMTNSVGCLEFWAKLNDFPSAMPAGASPGLIGWIRPGVNEGSTFAFSNNNGLGGGGVCAYISMGWSTTGYFGSWTYSNAIGGGAVSDWHHYALTWNAAGLTGLAGWSQKVAVFVDGVLNSSHGNSTANTTPFGTAVSDYQLGFLTHQGLVNGRVTFDNIKIWDYAKTDFSDRFTEDAGAPPLEDDINAGLQLYYPFSTNDGAVASDASGAGHDGVITGATWQDGGPIGGCLYFDGNADYVNAGTAVNFPAWDQYTVSVWFLNDGGGSNTGYGQKVFDKSSIGHDLYLASVPDNYNPCGWLTYYCKEGGVARGANAHGINVRTDNSWHHYVIVRDGTNCTSWLDGEMAASIHNMISVNSSSPLYIGYSASADSYQRRAWSGFIDEVRIYNRSLSEAEVLELYLQSSIPPVTYALRVDGARGAAEPADGNYTYETGNDVSASVSAVVTDGATRYLCTGATVAGNEFVMNGLTNVTLTITNDTTVTWNWQTQYKLETQTVGEGTVTPVTLWQDEGGEVVLTAVPAEGWIFDGWSGDLSGCTVNGSSITVAVSQARSITAAFVPLDVVPLSVYARRPENVPLRYRSNAGAWFYSNLVGGIYCSSPDPRRSVAMQLQAKGPGLLSFEWEFPGADGASVLMCSVGSVVRAVKQGAAAESISIAVASSGSPIVRWTLRRDAGSAELAAVIRNIVWKPLAPAALPVPSDQSVLLEGDFAGVAWNGDAQFYRVYAGVSRSLKPVGVGEYSGNSVAAEAFEALTAAAAGKPIYWRVDAVMSDSSGVEAVRRGALWSMTLLPDGSPEFVDPLPYLSDALKVGVFAEMGPIGCANGLAGELQCRVASGRLPAGMQAELREGALYIAGVPTRAGQYSATLQLSVKTDARRVMPGTTRGVELTVSKLGAVAGTYDGWLSDSIYGEGPVSLTVAASGRITGKFALNGRDYTLLAPFFDGISNGCCMVSAAVKHRSEGSFPATFAVTPDGWMEALCTEDPEALLVLTRNRWREEGGAELLANYAGGYQVALPPSAADPEGGGGISVLVSGTGRVSARIIGTMPNGRGFYASTTLMHVPETESDPARILAVIHVKPSSATDGQGLFGVLEIVADPDGIEPNAVIELIPLRWW